MDNMSTLRELYFAGKILNIGEIVEDSATGEQLKIVDRGSNYITVATSAGLQKKWITEVKQIGDDTPASKEQSDFAVNEQGQVQMFGYTTTHFDAELADAVLDGFAEFDDMFAKHQIIKSMDIVLGESETIERNYELVDRIAGFYTKHSVETPLLIEGLKDSLERKRIVQIIATVAGVELKDSLTQTMADAITALNKTYKERKQWLVLLPFLKIAKSTGISNALSGLPFGLSNVQESTDERDANLVTEFFEANLDEVAESICLEDIIDCYEDEYNDGIDKELVLETLTIQGRQKLARSVRQHETTLELKRARAINTAAGSAVLQNRARKLALTMLKRRMFRKSPKDMTRQEKERFEAGAARRKATVARLAQKLVAQVRAMQNARLHQQANQRPAVQSAAATAQGN